MTMSNQKRREMKMSHEEEFLEMFLSIKKKNVVQRRSAAEGLQKFNRTCLRRNVSCSVWS